MSIWRVSGNTRWPYRELSFLSQAVSINVFLSLSGGSENGSIETKLYNHSESVFERTHSMLSPFFHIKVDKLSPYQLI